jgi:hypothetical protein
MGRRHSAKRIVGGVRPIDLKVDYGKQPLLTRRRLLTDTMSPQDTMSLQGTTMDNPLTIPSADCIYIQKRESHVIGLVFRVMDSNTDTEIAAEVMVPQQITHPNSSVSKQEKFVSHSLSYKPDESELDKGKYVVKLVDVGGITQANIYTEKLPQFDNIKELF